MTLFSLFGKKKSPADPAENPLEAAPIDPLPEPPIEHPLSSPDPGLAAQPSQRDLARMTAEKIDAIESEIARDILTRPQTPPAENPPPETVATSVDTESGYAPTDLFRSTELRIDKETLLLFQHEPDK